MVLVQMTFVPMTIASANILQRQLAFKRH